MPVEFLTEDQQRRSGRYTEDPSPLQLARYFHFDDRDQQLIAQHQTEYTRLGFAVQLGTVRFLGTFLPNPTDVPAPVVAYVATQLGIRDTTCLAQYHSRDTHWDHAIQIRRVYGYHEFHEPREVLLRVAGSLQQGTVSASELMRSLLRSKRPSALARAIGALGRIPRTLYMLAYIDDEHYRRRILTQLNRGEGRHSVARAVFHGQRGELRQRYREGQEGQLGALGLVVNAIVLWNTLYMEAALTQLQHEGIDVVSRRYRATFTPGASSHQLSGAVLVCPGRVCGAGGVAFAPCAARAGGIAWTSQFSVPLLLTGVIAIANPGRGGRRTLPWAFTEHGILMLSSVLRSEQAVQVNIAIMRAFVRMREAMISHKEMARRIDDMERKYDTQFKAVFDALRRLMEPSASPKKRPIGYIIQENDDC